MARAVDNTPPSWRLDEIIGGIDGLFLQLDHERCLVGWMIAASNT
jgi:hypothetical protein